MGRYLGNQRIRTGLLVNWQLLPEVELSPAGYPLMQPVDMPADDSATLARFKDALTCEFPQSQGLQFFQDDYQFERVWAQPEKYLEVVARFKFTLQTNFSLYSDYPRPLNQWNHFRNQLLGAWWQARGLTVVPVAAWGSLGRPGRRRLCLRRNPDRQLHRNQHMGILQERRAPAAVPARAGSLSRRQKADRDSFLRQGFARGGEFVCRHPGPGVPVHDWKRTLQCKSMGPQAGQGG